MRITLPLPSKALHAHTSGHWRAKAAATRTARELACAFGLQSRGRGDRCDYFVRVSYQFFVPDMRVRDTVNLLQGMKPAIDGLVDAGCIYRDDWRWLQVLEIGVTVDRENPRVEITITGERE